MVSHGKVDWDDICTWFAKCWYSRPSSNCLNLPISAELWGFHPRLWRVQLRHLSRSIASTQEARTVELLISTKPRLNTQTKRFQSTVLLYMWLMQEVHTNALYHNHVAVVIVVIVIVVSVAGDCATLTSSSGCSSPWIVYIDSPFNLCGVACSPIVTAHLKLVWLAVWTYQLQRSVFRTWRKRITSQLCNDSCPFASPSKCWCLRSPGSGHLKLLGFQPTVEIFQSVGLPIGPIAWHWSCKMVQRLVTSFYSSPWPSLTIRADKRRNFVCFPNCTPSISILMTWHTWQHGITCDLNNL